MPELAVAILTWRGESLTRQCLESLLATGIKNDRILIVDNGSDTGEGERLAREFAANVLTNPTNGGVPAGYNSAIGWAYGNGMTHMLLANNDVEFTDRDLPTRLLGACGPGIAAVGPIIRTQRDTIWNAGTRVRRWLGLAQRTSRPWGPTPYDVDAIDGACMLVAVEAACKIGGLESDYFLYWEETDWCARARAAGLRVLVDPRANVMHAGWGSGNRRDTRRYALRNSLLFIRRNVRGFAGLSASMAWLFVRVPTFLVRRLAEKAGPRGVGADAAWAIGWHVRDIRQRGWRRPADGPDLCR